MLFTEKETRIKTLTITIEEAGGNGGLWILLLGEREIPVDSSLTFRRCFPTDKSIALTAIASPESRFDGWSGDVPSDQDGSNSFIAVSLDSNKNVTAKFVQRPDDDDSPPDDPDCYAWESSAGGGRGGWVWKCDDRDPKPGGGRPPKPIDGLCWDWQPTAGSKMKGGWIRHTLRR